MKNESQEFQWYYQYNYHGDVTELTDVTGAVVKEYNYDAFGIEENIDANDINSFRYTAEYFDKETGTIYLRARYYNPTIGRFLNQDSYLGDTDDPLSLNLYTYTHNNPVMFIDPSGHKPSVMESAQMSHFIYDATTKDYRKSIPVNGGWVLVDIYQPKGSGLKMGVFRRYKPHTKTYEYTIVNRGSTGKWYEIDWQNNYTQPFGKSQDMKDSIAFSKGFVKDHPGEEVTFSGHSQGGAEAVANAIATNKDAYVFNPATTFLKNYGLKPEDYTANMTVFVVEGDILNNFEKGFSEPLDKLVYLPTQHKKGSVNHSMEAVLNALNAYFCQQNQIKMQ